MEPQKRIYTALNRLPMTRKLLLIFVVCVLLPLVLQHIIYYGDIQNNIQKEMEGRLKTSLSERASSMNGVFSAVSALTLRYATDEMLYAFLDNDYATELSYLIAYQEHLRPTLQWDPTYRQVGNIIIYTDNASIFSGATVRKLSGRVFELDEALQDISWRPISPVNNNTFLRIAVVKKTSASTSDRFISIFRYLNHYPQHQKYQKLLRIDLNADEIASILARTELLENVLLIDEDRRVLAASNGYASMGPYAHFDETSLLSGQVAFTAPLSDVPSLSLVGIYDSRLFDDALQSARTRTLLITGSMLFIAVFAIAVIARSITVRLKAVTNQANEIARGNFVTISGEALGADEIALLARSTNQMAAQLQDAIEQEYEARLRQTRLIKEQTQAKLQALQSQVDPHFMFNALESIRLKAKIKGEEETGRMIMYMSRMFRHLIDWDEDIIRLEDDLKFLKEYLAIQQYRYDDDFIYSLDVQEQALCCCLPKMIIQPLVENACVHGVEAASNRREIHIAIHVSGGQLVITVSDNGGGIAQKQLTQLKAMLSGGEKLKGSVGLYNVYQRLSLYYGSGFAMDVSSRVKAGTVFYVSIPFRVERSAFHVSDHDRR